MLFEKESHSFLFFNILLIKQTSFQEISVTVRIITRDNNVRFDEPKTKLKKKKKRKGRKKEKIKDAAFFYMAALTVGHSTFSFLVKWFEVEREGQLRIAGVIPLPTMTM